MFKFFRLGRNKKTQPVDSKPDSVARANTHHHTLVQRELVKVVLMDTLRQHGIPAGWIGCDVTVMSHRTKDDKLLIHLNIMKWNEALLRYAPALQRQFMQGLDRFDPAVDHANYAISWRFSPQCECPFTTLPNPQFWSQDAVTPQAAATAKPTVAAVKLKFDLPPSSLDSGPSAFASTQPSSLDNVPSAFAQTQPAELH